MVGLRQALSHPTSHPDAAMPARPLALLLALLPAAGRAAEPPDHRGRGDLAVRARAVLRTHCAECHGEKPTRGGVSVLDHRQLTADRSPVRFVTPGEPDASRLLELIEDGAMPPGGRPRLAADEVAALRAWVAAKAPAYPAAFDDRYAAATMVDDVRQRLQNPSLRAVPLKSFGYVSFAHLAGTADPSPDLRAAEQRLRDALLAASGKPVALQPLDDAATVFRIDLRDTGWLTADLFDRLDGPAVAGVAATVPLDLLVLENPYPPALPGDQLDQLVRQAGQSRPAPLLRGDWLADALRKDAPLAAEMRSLSDLAAKGGEGVPGPVPKPFAGAKPARGPVPPLGAWYAGDVSADPPPFTLTAELVDPDGKPVAEVAERGRFQIRLKASADASFAVVRVGADGEVRLQKLSGTRLKAGQELLVRTDTGAPFVPLGAEAATATEHVVVFVTDRDLPELTVVRSHHPDDPPRSYPIQRFLPAGKVDGYDPARVVRTVLPLKVVKPKPDAK